MRIICYALFIAMVATSLCGQTAWTKHGNNPVLTGGTNGTWDDASILAPRVIFDGTTYKMWYSGDDGTHLRIGYAESSDGLTWTKHSSNPVLDLGAPGSWEDVDVASTSVILDGTTYKMWYTGVDGTYKRGGYAESSDGVNWTKHVNNPVIDVGASGSWDDKSLYPCSVIKGDSIYQMWYTGSNGDRVRIGYATSPDGITWTKHAQNPVIENGPFASVDAVWAAWPMVMATDNGYEMWYAGMNGSINRIMYATSVDGVNWQKYVGNPVLYRGSAGSWDDTHVSFPSVIRIDDQYKLWYAGHHDKYQIGMAEAPFVAVDKFVTFLPEAIRLNQNFPNPFNPSTTISYSLPEETAINLIIYDVLGQEVAELVNDQQGIGAYELKWDGTNGLGEQVATGLYFARLTAGKHSDVIKMLLLR